MLGPFTNLEERRVRIVKKRQKTRRIWRRADGLWREIRRNRLRSRSQTFIGPKSPRNASFRDDIVSITADHDRSGRDSKHRESKSLRVRGRRGSREKGPTAPVKSNDQWSPFHSRRRRLRAVRLCSIGCMRVTRYLFGLQVIPNTATPSCTFRVSSCIRMPSPA